MPSGWTALEPCWQGECPEPWVVSWDDAAGVDLVLAGFTGTASWRVNGGAQVTRALVVSESTTAVTWQASDHLVPGVLAGEVSISDGFSGPYKHGFQRVVRPARG